MIIVMHRNAEEVHIQQVIDLVRKRGGEAHCSQGLQRTVIEVVGEGAILDSREIAYLEGVIGVLPLSQFSLLTSRASQAEDTVIQVGSISIGGKSIVIMAGPCAVESRDQLETIAPTLERGGATVLRGGAFKPRTSPYAFQGMGEEALKILSSVAREHRLAVVSEVMDVAQIEMMMEHVDILQVGARNMQNTVLLKALGEISKPILLKRGLAATVDELLYAAEYILARGNHQVMLCERGIRAGGEGRRYLLDITVIPILKRLTHLPIIVDPSHATRHRSLVAPVARAAVAAGADGLLIEVHPDPDSALSDGAQSLYPDQFLALTEQLREIARPLGRAIASRPESPT